MTYRNTSIASDASREIKLLAQDLCGKHVGWAFKKESYLSIADPIFITNISTDGQQIIVHGFSVERGVPTIHEDYLASREKLVLFPDLRLAMITPDRAGSKESPIESISMSLPHGFYDSANDRKDKRNGWRVESFEGSQAKLIRQ